MAEPAERKWWHPLWQFAVHGLVGSAIFVVITAPAVLLSLLVKWLEDKKTNPVLVSGLKGAEYFVFGVDLLLFGWFVIRTAYRAAKDL